MSVSTTGSFISFSDQNGNIQIAVYSTIANGTADASAINAAVKTKSAVVIGNYLADTNYPNFTALPALFVTPE